MAEKKFRVFTDYSRRVYSEPVDAESMEELLKRFNGDWDGFEVDDTAEEEEMVIRCGVEELVWDEEDQEWTYNDELSKEY